MPIRIKGATEHNLRGIDIDIPDGLTAVTGVSGSGKSSLVFDTLYHEARRRFLDIFTLQSSSLRLNPAQVESIDGLLPAVAVAQNVLNRNPASTVATASGIHPFIRLLFAAFGTRACAKCGEPVLQISTDEVVEHLVRTSTVGAVDVRAPVVTGVKGSHTTLLSLLEREFGKDAITVDGRRHTENALDPEIPHDIDIHLRTLGVGSRMSDVREAVDMSAGLGSTFLKTDSAVLSLAPVCSACGEWMRDLSQTAFHQPCPYCGGEGCSRCDDTGMHPDAAATRWGGFRIDELLALPVTQFIDVLNGAPCAGGSKRLKSEMLKRAAAIQALGLGYLTLDRISPSLSRGESQRLRLSVCLTSKLELLHVLDEPSIGLHPSDVGTLFKALRKLTGPVVYIEHERAAVAAADTCIDVGPRAGSAGGELVFDGSPRALWESNTATGVHFSLRERVILPEKRSVPEAFLSISGACNNNLRSIDVKIPVGRMTVVTGVSGSGKSSLVQGVLAASFDAATPVFCDDINTHDMICIHVDQGPIGINPRSNPATYTKLADVIRDVFASLTGLSTSAFSFNRKEGACPACNGLGAGEISMRYLPSTWVTCPACEGRRFSEEILETTVEFGGQKLNVADIYDRSVDEVANLLLAKLDEDPYVVSASKRRQARAVLQAFLDIGLGYLSLGQPSPTLSGGEAQRIKLTKHLGRRNLDGQLLILDEPSTGLHPADVAGLLSIFDRLTRQGTTLVIVEHNQDIVRAADWIVDLGPGAGPEGGRVLYMGDVSGLESCAGSRTGEGLRDEMRVKPRKSSDVARNASSGAIEIQNASVNNLRGVNVGIPKGGLTVVTGVSGSGKSSLVGGVLEAEARRRYLETLSMYELQSCHESGAGAETLVAGLGVTVAVNPSRGRYNLRSNIGTTSEIIHRLSVLCAASEERHCLECGAKMVRRDQWNCPDCGASAPLLESRRFLRNTYASACRKCHGVGSLRTFNWRKLIVRPDLPLCAGAMHSPGFFPKGYLCKPFNGGYDEVRALARKYEFDPESTPWSDMSEKAHNAFLYGEDEPMEVVYRSRTGRAGTRVMSFHGFVRWIGDWDIGGTYTDTESCEDCGGSGLRPESLAVKLDGYSIHQLSELPLSELLHVLAHYHPAEGASRYLNTVHQTAVKRAGFLVRSGLGYLHLNRLDATLSAGEAQRVKLAGLLGSGLSRLTILLDEPSRGMHPRELEALVAVVKDLRDEGNTIVVVEHEPLFIEAADTIIDMGPAAGSQGGQVVYCGDLPGLLENPGRSETGRWMSGAAKTNISRQRRRPSGWFTLKSVSENNLRGGDVHFPLGVVAGVCGVSGSGKSTLVVDTLGRILAPTKQTTSVAYEPVEPGANGGVVNAPPRTVIVDQALAGVRTPGVFLELEPHIAARYTGSAEAAAHEYDVKSFTRTCTACGGAGRTRLDMGFLPDVYSECAVCRGTGYPPEAQEVTLKGMTIADLSQSTLQQVYDLWGADPKIGPPLAEAISLGLGYLVFHQPAHTLSGGEAQRLKIAKELARKRGRGTLYILDEPTVGQHLADVARLASTLHRLAAEGDSVLVVEHHMHLLAECDWLIELGPGPGPDGGTVVAEGTPEKVASGKSASAPYLRDVLQGDNK